MEELHDATGAWGAKKVRGRPVLGMRRMTFLLDEAGGFSRYGPQSNLTGMLPRFWKRSNAREASSSVAEGRGLVLW